jgi:prepilin signal peptidase PulO-like enzyme (type II secretory pathway)
VDFDPVLSVAYLLLADGTGVFAAGKRGDASVRLEIPFAPWMAAGSVRLARSR